MKNENDVWKWKKSRNVCNNNNDMYDMEKYCDVIKY